MQYKAILENAGYRVVAGNSLMNLLIKRFTLRSPILITALDKVLPLLLTRRAIFVHHGFPIKSFTFFRFLGWWVIYALLKRLHHVRNIAVSNFTAAVIRDIQGIPNVRVVPNSLPNDWTWIRRTNSEARDIDVIYVGRYVGAKGVETILQIFAQASLRHNLRAMMVLAGNENAIREKLPKDTKHINFIFNATAQEVRFLLLRSKVFISLNPTEPFGLAYLEAASCGCSVISYRSGGGLEILTDQKNAHFVDIDASIDELAKKVNFALSSWDCNYIPSIGKLNNHLQETQRRKLLDIVSQI